MARVLDIGIAGCGVAGLASGALLARAGHRVTIFDKLEAPSPVGSGLILQPVGLAVLRELGVETRIAALGARIDRLYGKSNGAVVLDVRYAALGGAAHGVAVHRAALFDALFDAAGDAGVAIESGRTLARTECSSGDWREIVFADGARTAPFDLVIDALGVRSDLSRRGVELVYGALWANVAWRDGFAGDALEQRYDAARKMTGVLPIGAMKEGGAKLAAYFWSLRADRYEAWRAAPIDAWKEEAYALWPQTAPLLEQITSHDDLVFARYAHRTLANPIDVGLAHVGDSYHCTSPQLGQGANMAMLDALALARALERQDDLNVALDEYARMRRLHVWLYQSASFLFTPFYQGDGRITPWFRDRVAGPVSRIWPAPQVLAALVAGRIGAPLGAMGRAYALAN
ncbi:MAG: NAD(P)/FAD-dependent oxidoreductase [Caulobacterales bacterium]